jgi:hypothetical protein
MGKTHPSEQVAFRMEMELIDLERVANAFSLHQHARGVLVQAGGLRLQVNSIEKRSNNTITGGRDNFSLARC